MHYHLGPVLDPEQPSGFHDLEDERRRQVAEQTVRDGQQFCRLAVLEAHGNQCAITETNLPAALQAAHIAPYMGTASNSVSNGLCLRADIHAMFDRHMLAIHEDSLAVLLSRRTGQHLPPPGRGAPPRAPQDDLPPRPRGPGAPPRGGRIGLRPVETGIPRRFIQTVTCRPPPRCEGRKRVQVDSVPSMVDASSPSPPPSTVPVRRGNGLPVVAVHGNGVDHRLLLATDEALSEAGGLERIYLDLPGFGCTPPLSGTGGLPELADWLVEHVIQLVGTGTFALLGNSLGGLLARHIRANLPEQVVGMALIAPVVNPDRASRTLPPFHAVEKDETLLESLSAADRDDFTEMTSRQTRSTWGRFATFAPPTRAPWNAWASAITLNRTSTRGPEFSLARLCSSPAARTTSPVTRTNLTWLAPGTRTRPTPVLMGRDTTSISTAPRLPTRCFADGRAICRDRYPGDKFAETAYFLVTAGDALVNACLAHGCRTATPTAP